MIGFKMSFIIFELYISNATGNAIDADNKLAIVILKNEYLIAITNCPLLIVSIKSLKTTLGSGTNIGLALFAQIPHMTMILANNTILFISVFTPSYTSSFPLYSFLYKNSDSKNRTCDTRFTGLCSTD